MALFLISELKLASFMFSELQSARSFRFILYNFLKIKHIPQELFSSSRVNFWK